MNPKEGDTYKESSPDVETREIGLTGVDLRRIGELFAVLDYKLRLDYPGLGDEQKLQMEVLPLDFQLALFQFIRGKLQPHELVKELEDERKKLSLPRSLMGNDTRTVHALMRKRVAIKGAPPFAPLANEDQVNLARDHFETVAFQLGRLVGLCNLGFYGKVELNPVGFGPAQIRTEIESRLGLPALKTFDTLLAGTVLYRQELCG
jgi:hypothetical protein